MNRKEFQILAGVRLTESRWLMRAGLSDGAYYLAGYSVECGLKACIAKRTRRYDFPEKKSVDASHTHDLKALVRMLSLELPLAEQCKNDAIFNDNWDVVQRWSEQSRYRRHDETDAKAIVEAVGSPRHGVLRWIKQHW